MIEIADAQFLVELEEQESAIRGILSEQFMQLDYARQLYGGWQHPDGRFITRGHAVARRLHEAAKQLFCRDCWITIGFIGSDPNETFPCRQCGKEWRLRGPMTDRVGMYVILFISGGSRSGKSNTGCSEFCSWLEGRRPWDGSLTCLEEQGGDWLMCAPTHTEHFPKTNIPYFLDRLGHRCVDSDTDTQGNTRSYTLDFDGRIERVWFTSYEQAIRTAALEGGAYKGAWLDEVPKRKLMPSIFRGLVNWASRGWGRCLITGTSYEDEYLQNMIYDRSWNRGGSEKTFFSIPMAFLDNPSLTPAEETMLKAACTTPEMEAMRLRGEFRSVIGRVYRTFDTRHHVYDAGVFDPLFTLESQDLPWDERTPSDWPIVHSVDPHDKRPWAMSWTVLSPHGDGFVRFEWPTEPYETLTTFDNTFEAYREIISSVEAQIPGGSERVIMRLMDPKFGPSSKMGMGIKSVQEAMRDVGYYFLTKIEASLESRHAALRDMLRFDDKAEKSALNRPHFFIEQGCRNCIYALLNYVHAPPTGSEKDVNQRPLMHGKDHADTMGWFALMRPPFRPVRGSIESRAYNAAMRDKMRGFGFGRRRRR